MRDALVELLGKPIAEPTALFIPMGIYPFPAAQGGMEGDLRGHPRPSVRPGLDVNRSARAHITRLRLFSEMTPRGAAPYGSELSELRHAGYVVRMREPRGVARAHPAAREPSKVAVVVWQRARPQEVARPGGGFARSSGSLRPSWMEADCGRGHTLGRWVGIRGIVKRLVRRQRVALSRRDRSGGAARGDGNWIRGFRGRAVGRAAGDDGALGG